MIHLSSQDKEQWDRKSSRTFRAVDTIIVPVSGGSLISGIAIAAKSIKPSIEILGVQPETTPAMYYSLKAGKIIDVEMRDTIADGLSGNIEKGSITFEIIQRYVEEILLYDNRNH